jgi:hypothetical protein
VRFAPVVALLVAAAVTAGAEPVARFARGTVPGTLRYQVVSEGGAPGDISGALGELTNLDVLAGPVLSQQIAWRGAQPTAITVLTWVLRARTLGPIAVGPTKIKLGETEAVTNAVTGAALVGGRSDGESARPELRAELSASSLAVGEPLVVRFSVAAPTETGGGGWEVQATFPDSWSERLPQPEAVGPTGRPAAGGTLALGGWLVMPIRAGRLEIPPAVARVADWGADQDNPVAPEAVVTSRPMAVDVHALPSAPGPFFGAVGELEFSRRLLEADVESGGMAAVEVEARGVGNLPLFDAPPLPLPAGVRGFAAEETHAWQATRRGLAGWRKWRIPLEAARPGSYSLPAVTFCSYLPGRAYATHTLPALALTVEPAKAAVIPAEPVRPPQDRAPLPFAGLVAAAFVAGAGSVVALRAWRARRARSASPAGAVADPTGELRALQAAVEAWARTRYGVAVAQGAERLAAAGCPAADAAEAVALVRLCERLRLAPGLADPADALADLRVRASHLTATGSAAAGRLTG